MAQMLRQTKTKTKDAGITIVLLPATESHSA
jgi:hypothetical protein